MPAANNKWPSGTAKGMRVVTTDHYKVVCSKSPHPRTGTLLGVHGLDRKTFSVQWDDAKHPTYVHSSCFQPEGT